MTPRRTTLYLTTTMVMACACTAVTWPYNAGDDSPVLSVAKPEGFKKSDFGFNITPVYKPLGAEEPEGMFMGVSAGPASPTSMHRLSMGLEIRGGKMVRLYASNIQEDPYALYLTGTAMTATAEWTYLDEVHPDLGCLILGEPGYEGVATDAGGFTRFCLDTTDSENPRRVEGSGLRTQALMPPEGAGRSVTVIPYPGTETLKYVVLGAVGSAHLVNDGIDMNLAPSIEPPATDAPDDYGVAVVAGSFDDDWPVWLAVGSNGRVYVYAVWDDPVTSPPDYPYGPDPDHVWLTACYDSPDREGFGTLLFSGDADDDGVTDLVIASETKIVGRPEEIVIVSGSTLLATLPTVIPPDPYPAVLCEDVPEDLVIACTDHDTRNVTCGEFPMFGASVAMGDLDGDGSSEVIVGSPGAKVGQKNNAGAVFVFDPDDPTAPVTALRDAVPASGAHLGQSVAVAEIAGEAEAMAGAPGTNEFFVFFCSGVGTDSVDDSTEPRCR